MNNIYKELKQISVELLKSIIRDVKYECEGGTLYIRRQTLKMVLNEIHNKKELDMANKVRKILLEMLIDEGFNCQLHLPQRDRCLKDSNAYAKHNSKKIYIRLAN